MYFTLEVDKKKTAKKQFYPMSFISTTEETAGGEKLEDGWLLFRGYTPPLSASARVFVFILLLPRAATRLSAKKVFFQFIKIV